MSLNALLPFSAATLLLVGANSFAGPKSSAPVLTQADVKNLAYQALRPNQKHLPQLSIEIDLKDGASRYIYVTAYWRGVPNGSAVVDNFAIDKLTGDVWSATMSCSEKKNAELERLQARLRRKMKMSLHEYYRLKAHGPLCNS